MKQTNISLGQHTNPLMHNGMEMQMEVFDEGKYEMNWEKQLTDNQSEMSMENNISNLTKIGEKSNTPSTSMHTSPKTHLTNKYNDKRYDNGYN